MYYKKTLELVRFEFWSYAKDHLFTRKELIEIGYSLEEHFIENIPTETDINDLFWHDEEFLCDSIGLKFEEYEKRI
mgnify:CR=1 FL=1